MRCRRTQITANVPQLLAWDVEISSHVHIQLNTQPDASFLLHMNANQNKVYLLFLKPHKYEHMIH